MEQATGAGALAWYLDDRDSWVNAFEIGIGFSSHFGLLLYRILAHRSVSLEIQRQRFSQIVSGIHPGMAATGGEAFVFDLFFLQEIVKRDCRFV